MFVQLHLHEPTAKTHVVHFVFTLVNRNGRKLFLCYVFIETSITLLTLDFHKILQYKTFNNLNYFITKEQVSFGPFIKR